MQKVIFQEYFKKVSKKIMNYLADMISRIRVAMKKRASFVIIANTKECARILTKMHADGYISQLTIINERTIKIILNYKHNMVAIRELKILSTPGLKHYISAEKLRDHQSHYYDIYLMTNIGLLNRAEAIAKNKGGIALLSIR
jgi:ribosomal protein S8